MSRSTQFRARHRRTFTVLMTLCAASCWSASSQAAGEFASDSPWMTGDWGGLRSEWLAKGIDVEGGYFGESASNLRGGYDKHHTTRYADQFSLGVAIDLQKLMGWNDTKFNVAISNRNGDSLNNDNINDPRAGSFSSTQQIQGRGSVTRLSELWLSKGWFDDRLNIKAGRFSVGDEFAVEDCLFQNLSLCGSQPGNYVNSIYNGPISQWAARVKYRLTDEVYAQVGIYDVNPSNLDNDNGFKLNGAGTTGALVPVELVWSPKVNDLPGEYRVGYYHSTANGTDLYKDANNQPAAQTGDAYRSDASRHGWWVVGKQQLTSRNGDASRGLNLTASMTFQDAATTPVDNYQKVSLVYKGPFDARPTDTMGIGIARMHASNQLLRNAKTANQESGLSYDDAGYVPEQHTEYDAEINYGVQVTRWLNVMPNLQYVAHPGGVRDVQNGVVAGLQVQSQF